MGWISQRHRLAGRPKHPKVKDKMSSRIGIKKTDSFWSEA
jgi:hypothetical protein